MNKYKIDFNQYSVTDYPFALFAKPKGLFSRWEFVQSFRTKEDAREAYKKIVDLPEYLS